MVTIKLVLDTRKPNKQQLFPICFRIYHDKKATIRSAKIYIREDQWNEEKRTIKTNHPSAAILNRRLAKDYADLQSELLLADDEKVKEFLAPKVVEPAIEPEPEVKTSVYTFTAQLIEELRIDNRIGNSWVYESTVKALRGNNEVVLADN